LGVEKIGLSEVETEAARIVKEKKGLGAGAYMGLMMMAIGTWTSILLFAEWSSWSIFNF